MFNWNKPTAQILGRFNPWNEGHQALFEEVLRKADPDRQPRYRDPTSEAQQVCIMVRSTGENFNEIKSNITKHLDPEFQGRYIIIQVPNVTNIFYGRQVGFDVDRIDLPSNLEPVDNQYTTRAEKKAKEYNFWANRE